MKWICTEEFDVDLSKCALIEYRADMKAIMFVAYTGQTHCPAVTVLCDDKESFERCRGDIREFYSDSRSHLVLQKSKRTLDMD
jgi:hypothetical protein